MKSVIAQYALILALITSAWFALAAGLAPFGFGPAILITAGASSLAALFLAASKPRQILVLTIASLLTLGHAALWLMVINVALHERGIL